MTSRPRLRRRPRVSVIIASYRWPEALRLSLATALAQSVDDIEVLVIEDGPDEASRGVVREAHDRRARWMRLAVGTGSQSGPNALGIREARAPIVAYLGHDDVWHPNHLALLLAALAPDIDAAHAIALYLRDGGDGHSLVAGSTPCEPSTFVPPSALMHWRDSPRIGAWVGPERTGMPVDFAFLMACHSRGARFAATGQPTAFKYPASWRVDSYRSRDVAPQLRLRERLVSDPSLGARLLHDALGAGAPPDMGAPPRRPIGVIHDYTRRLKGLPARFAARVTSWTPDPVLVFPGWHAVESDERGSFAWTGPGERAFVRLDAPQDGGDLGVRVTVRAALTDRQLRELVVELDGEAVDLTQTMSPLPAYIVTGWLSRPAQEAIVEVGLRAPPGPASDHDPATTDTRRLGVAVSTIELLTRGK